MKYCSCLYYSWNPRPHTAARFGGSLLGMAWWNCKCPIQNGVIKKKKETDGCGNIRLKQYFISILEFLISCHILAIIVISQSINQPTNQATNQPTKQASNQSINQPTNQATNQSINQSINQTINQTSTSLSNTDPVPFLPACPFFYPGVSGGSPKFCHSYITRGRSLATGGMRLISWGWGKDISPSSVA